MEGWINPLNVTRQVRSLHTELERQGVEVVPFDDRMTDEEVFGYAKAAVGILSKMKARVSLWGWLPDAIADRGKRALFSLHHVDEPSKFESFLALGTLMRDLGVRRCVVLTHSRVRDADGNVEVEDAFTVSTLSLDRPPGIITYRIRPRRNGTFKVLEKLVDEFETDERDNYGHIHEFVIQLGAQGGNTAA